MTQILWLTGLSGSGKTTISKLLEREFIKKGKTYLVIDGDLVREKLHMHLGFTLEDILENNLLIQDICEEKMGLTDYLIVPVISPLSKSREIGKKRFGDNLIEIYVKCSYEECKRRDVKGLYLMAERGEIKNFIGKDIPYEPPKSPNIEVNTETENSLESVAKIIRFLDSYS